MLGINKRLDKIEYRLARIDKMLEDMLTAKKSVVVHKPQKQPDLKRYPDKIVKAMSGRYQTVDKIAERIGSTELSVHTYLKIMRKDGVEILTRGRAPTEYKLAKGAIKNG
jgi:biotin operon repressor